MFVLLENYTLDIDIRQRLKLMDEHYLRIITRIRAECPRLKCRDLKNKCDEYIVFFTKQVHALAQLQGVQAQASQSRGELKKIRYVILIQTGLAALNYVYMCIHCARL